MNRKNSYPLKKVCPPNATDEGRKSRALYRRLHGAKVTGPISELQLKREREGEREREREREREKEREEEREDKKRKHSDDSHSNAKIEKM